MSVIQQVKCRWHIILSPVACMALPYFSTLSYTWQFSKKTLLNIDCVLGLPLSTTFVWNISHSKKNSVRYCHKCTYVWSDLNKTWIFWIDLKKNLQISNFINIHLVEAQLFHVDGRTDMMTLRVAFSNFLIALNITLGQIIVIFTHTLISASSHFLAQ